MLQLIVSQAEELSPLSETALRGLHGELLQYYAPAAHYRGRYKAVKSSCSPRPSKRRGKYCARSGRTGPYYRQRDGAACALVQCGHCRAPLDRCRRLRVRVSLPRYSSFSGRQWQDRPGAVFASLASESGQSLRTVVQYLAIDRHIEKQREDYYIVLRRCSGGRFAPEPTAYSYEPFLRFMVKVMSQALGDVVVYRKRYAALQELAPSALTVLAAFKEQPQTRLQRKTSIERTGLPRATVTVALRTLHERGFVQRHGRGAAVSYQLAF